MLTLDNDDDQMKLQKKGNPFCINNVNFFISNPFREFFSHVSPRFRITESHEMYRQQIDKMINIMR